MDMAFCFGVEPELTAEHRLTLHWLANESTGDSARTMAFWLAFGIKMDRLSHPREYTDFDRCLGLLDRIPSLRRKLDRMTDLSQAWKSLTDSWGVIERVYRTEVGEDPGIYRPAPLTDALLRTLLRGTTPLCPWEADPEEDEIDYRDLALLLEKNVTTLQGRRMRAPHLIPPVCASSTSRRPRWHLSTVLDWMRLQLPDQLPEETHSQC